MIPCWSHFTSCPFAMAASWAEVGAGFSTGSSPIFVGLPDDDDDGPECEEKSAAECSASGGVNMGAGSCDPNPCAPTPPGIVTCCVPEDDQGEQEDEDETARSHRRESRPVAFRRADRDEQEGEPEHEPPECERLTTADCTDEGGTVSSAASCEPNPCVASPCGAFLN